MPNKNTAKITHKSPDPETMYGVFLRNTSGEHVLTKQLSSQDEAVKFVQETLIADGDLSTIAEIIVWKDCINHLLKLRTININMTVEVDIDSDKYSDTSPKYFVHVMYAAPIMNINRKYTCPETEYFSSYEEAEEYVKKTLIGEGTLSDKGKIDICVEHEDQTFRLCSIYVDMTRNHSMGKQKKKTKKTAAED